MLTPDPETPHRADDEGTAALLDSGPRAERLLGWGLLAGVVALAVLSFATNAATRFYTWPWIYYWHVLLALAPLAFVVGALARRPAPRLGAALDVGLVLWAATAVNGAWWSPHREAALDAALLPLAAVCLAYVLRGWLGFDPAISRQRAAQAFTVVAVLAAAFVVVSWSYWILFDLLPARAAGASWWQVLHIRNEHPLGHSNYTAGFIVLTLPVLVTQVINTPGGRRIVWLVVSLASLALIPLTSSRGGVLGVFALGAGALALVLSGGGLQRRTRILLATAVLVSAGVLVAVNPRLREMVVHRAWSGAASESNRQRLAMAEAGWAMGVDRPWRGWGPGTVSLVYPRYRAQLSGGVDNVLQLHSLPVQVWAEQGIFGLAALLALGAGIVMRAWRLRPGAWVVRASSRADRARAWAAVLALSGYAVFALTDHQLDVPLYAGVVAALLAILSALTRSPGLTHVAWSPTFVRIVPAVLVAAATALIGWHAAGNLRAREAFVHGVIALEQGEEEGFLTGVTRARELAPWEPFYPNQLAFHVIGLMERAEDPARAASLRAQAIATLRQSLAILPAQEICEMNLGWLLLDAEKPAEAAGHFRAAARLVPDKGGVYFGLGLALLLQGREAEAVRALALEWINDPQAIAHSVWLRDDWQARRAAVAVAAQAMLVELAASDPRTAVAKRAAYLHALIGWWLDPTPATAARVVGAATTREQQDFFHAVHAGEASSDPSDGPNASWQIVQRAWSAPEPANVLAQLPEGWARWREPIASRIQARRESFADFLTGPGPGMEGLIRYERPGRTAYGMHARNSDGLRIIDRTPREDNVLVAMLPGSIFPAKGWLPAPTMVRLLATVPE